VCKQFWKGAWLLGICFDARILVKPQYESHGHLKEELQVVVGALLTQSLRRIHGIDPFDLVVHQFWHGISERSQRLQKHV
jgi:hypothetical protein